MKLKIILFFTSLSGLVFSFDNISQLDYFCEKNGQEYTQGPFETISAKKASAAISLFLTKEKKEYQSSSFFNDNSNRLGMSLFTQKKIFNHNSKIAIWGDIHGSLHSLVRELRYLVDKKILDEDLKIIDPNFYMVFLGNYVDRGFYGFEVILTLITLKLKNPGKVFLVRGAHEDFSMNKSYEFIAELEEKYGRTVADHLLKQIVQIYDYMPLAFFIGTMAPDGVDFVQCCHGGIEIGYKPKDFLNSNFGFEKLNFISRKKNIESDYRADFGQDIDHNIPGTEIQNFEPRGLTNPVNIGLVWSDFICENNENIKFVHGRGWHFGRAITSLYLKKSSNQTVKLRSIIRGHQYHGRMLQNLTSSNGLFKMWDNQVCTLLSAPASGIYGFNQDSFVILTVKNNFDRWSFDHVSL